MNENEVRDWILDPPDLLESVERWEKWLADLRKLPQEHPGVTREIADAERWIPRRIELEQELQSGPNAYANPGRVVI
jgi:hypothetical protein